MYSRVPNNRGKGGGGGGGGGEKRGGGGGGGGWLKLFQKLQIGGIGIMVGGKGVKKGFLF